MKLSEDYSMSKRDSQGANRVKMIFSVMASPDRIDILRILNLKGPLSYSDIKSMAGFLSKKESGKFAYHLRKLLRQSLVALNRTERRYTVTNLGKIVLSLARQIEERSIIESGKMYVRTTGQTIDEFNSYKIVQSLVREGSLPLDLAQKISDESEAKIYKYQTTYLTGALIREVVNNVLLEFGHEEYRGKMARLGLPGYDVRDMLSNLDSTRSGAGDLLSDAGQAIFSEYLLTSVMPKDVVDFHLAGDLHISNLGTWSMIPDTIFVNVQELLQDGIDLDGKYMEISRFPKPDSLDDLAGALSTTISILSREASREVVLDGLGQVLAEYSEPASEIERMLTISLMSASISAKQGRAGALTSIMLHTGANAKINGAVMRAYKNYVKITPSPRIGLIINYQRGRIAAITEAVSEVVMLGGRVTFTKNSTSCHGITSNPAVKNAIPLSIMLESVSINLPRLAFESNKDETYFRARLALLIKPILAAMILRKKDISDITRKGLNPILAKNTQYMQKSPISLVINLVGLKEAVFNILGYQDNRQGREILCKVVDTAVDVGAKAGQKLGSTVVICISDDEGSSRFIGMDAAKYGKASIIDLPDSQSYSQGMVLSASSVHTYTPKSSPIAICNMLAKLLNGGLAVTLDIDDKFMEADDVEEAIKVTSKLVSSFTLLKEIMICAECGFKDKPFEEKCPRCHSPYVG